MEDSGEKMMKQEKRKWGYFNIALAAIIIVTLGIVFARLFYISSQDKILNLSLIHICASRSVVIVHTAEL